MPQYKNISQNIYAIPEIGVIAPGKTVTVSYEIVNTDFQLIAAPDISIASKNQTAPIKDGGNK